MARSQPQWRRGSQLLLLAAAVAFVLLVAAGSADAAACNSPWKYCGGKCVNPQTDPLHCGRCNYVCPVPKNGWAECKDGQCKKKCPANWYYNSAKNECYH